MCSMHKEMVFQTGQMRLSSIINNCSQSSFRKADHHHSFKVCFLGASGGDPLDFTRNLEAETHSWAVLSALQDLW